VGIFRGAHMLLIFTKWCYARNRGQFL
jgi:hypothetical protein